MFHIRLGNHHKEEIHTRKLLEEIKKHPGCCDVVWFASEYGYPMLKTHQDAAEKMCRLAELYREQGIQVDLQISNTIGHGEYMKSKDCSAIDAYGFEKLVGHDGTVADYSFCWYGENFRKYQYETMKMYAALKPVNIWIDDDMRASNHAPAKYGCFCDSCMARFNAKYGSNFTREELVNEVCNGDVTWRKRFMDFAQEGLSDFAAMLARATMEVSPETHVGLQYGMGDKYVGGTYEPEFEALYKTTGLTPVSRSGGGVYDDKDPRKLLTKQIQMSYATSRLPEYVTLRVPEIENTPDVPMGKSNYGTLLESSIALAYGYTGLSYATLMTAYETMDFHGKLLAGMSRCRPYWQKMIEYNRRTVPAGLGIADTGVDYIKAPVGTVTPETFWDEEQFAYGGIPSLYGTPLTWIGMAENHVIGHTQVLSLNLATLDTLTDDEIRKLMERPVITDGMVIDRMVQRGFGPELGITIEYPAPQPCYELFDGKKWTVSSWSSVPLPTMVIHGPVTEISRLYNSVTHEYLGVANGIVQLSKAKWAVYGYGLWHHIISTEKRTQIMDAMDAIADNKMPAILKDAEQVTIIPRTTTDGKAAMISVLNISIAPTDALHLLVRNPDGEKFTYENGDFSVELTPVKTEDGYLLELPGFTRGWDMATVFISK